MAEGEFNLRVVIEAQYGDIIRTQQQLNAQFERGEITAQQFSRATEGLSKNLLNTSKAEANAATAAERYARAQNTAEKSTRGQNAAVGDLAGNLPRLRYALYDVSTSLAVTGVALTAIAAGAYGVNIAFDRAFADVQRTTFGAVDGVTVFQSSVDGLRGELVGLSQEIPLAFGEIARIASLAGQLNVPTEGITEFTELTAKFAATTDVSVDAAAEAFGRLRELLDIPDEDLIKLGSSILQVGVNAVATESDIIAISTQIAGVANQAGLTADEVFGLSAALASVGIQPELARGTITRLFGNIDRAVAAGGVSLDDFGKIAGQSGEEFANGWNAAPTDTLLDFFDGLANREGPAAEQALRQLGITSVRDVPALLRLAQTADTILKPALAEAAAGIQDGTAINEQYGIVADTVAEKLVLFSNNFQALLDSLGQSSAVFGPLLDLANGFLQTLTDLASNPVGATIAAIGIALAGLAGVLTLVLAGVTLTTGGLLAARTAINEATGGTGRLADAFRILTASILGSNAALATNTAAMRGNAAATTSAAAANTAATGAAGKFSAVLGKAGLVGALLAVAPALFEGFNALEEWSLKAAGATQETSTYIAALKELQATQATGGTGTDQFGQIVAPLISAGPSNAGDLKPGQLPIGQELKVAREELAKYDEALAQTAINGEAAFATDQLQKHIRSLTEAGYSTDVANSYFENTIAALDGGGAAADDASNDFQVLSAAVDETLNSFFDIIDGELAVESALYDLGNALGQGGNDWSQYSEAGRANIEAVMGAAQALAAQTPGDAAGTAASLQGLFNSIVAGGFASAQQLAFLANTIAALNGQAAAAGQQVVAPRKIDLSSLSSGFDAGTRSATKAANAARKVQKEVRTLVDYANDLEKVFSRAFDIRFGSESALDDIASSFNDIREANEAARESIDGYLDDINSAKQGIVDYRVEIQQLKADMKELTADRNVAKYFLDVANAYGDQLRAGVLRAEIAKIDADIADAQNDVKKAQKGVAKENDNIADSQAAIRNEQNLLTRSTSGNSAEAIANREILRSLSGQYQTYIQRLAESGADQATLNAAVDQSEREFQSQARALGFSDAALRPYIQSFNDLRVAIQNVPRNITVSANTNPAKQALNEFLAQVRNSRADAQVGGGGAYGAGQRAGTDFKNGFDEILRRRTHQWEIQQTLPSGVRSTIGGLTFASGGYVSGPGSATSDSIPARLSDGEFVMQASAVNRLGVGYLNALNNGRAPVRNQTFASPDVAGGSGITRLHPADIRAIAAAVPKYTILANTPIDLARNVAQGNQQLTAQGAQL